MARDQKVVDKYKNFLEDAEKVLGRKLSVTTGGKSANHKKGALDIGTWSNKLTKEEYNKVGDLALRHGYRLGDEKNHLHVDDNHIQKGILQPRVFDEGWKTAPESNQFIQRMRENTKAKGSYLFGLPKEEKKPISRGPASIPQIEPERVIMKEDEELKKKARKAAIDQKYKKGIDILMGKSGEEVPPVVKEKAIEQDHQKIEQVKAKEVIKFKDKVEDIDRESEVDKNATLLKANKKEVMKSIDASELFSVDQKKLAKEHINSDESIDNSRNIANKPDEDLSPSENFKKAMLFFAPQLLGGLVGSAIGGERGAIAGYEESGKLRDAFIDYNQNEAKLQQSKLKQQKQEKMDITPDFFDTRTDTALFSRTDPETGLPGFINDKGEKVPSEFAQSYRVAQAEKRQKGIGDRQQISLADKHIDRQSKGLNDFRFVPGVTKMIDSNDSIDPIINLLESGMPITSEFITSFIAKGVQQQSGMLSEGDVQRARVPMSWYKKFGSDISGLMQGDMSPEERKNTIKILRYMSDRNKLRLKDRIKGYANKDRASRLGLSEKDFVRQLEQYTGTYVPEHVKNKIGPDAVAPKKKSGLSEEAEKRRQYLRKKYPNAGVN